MADKQSISDSRLAPPVLARGAGGARSLVILLLSIVLCFVLQLWLVFNQAINWDEFRYLADVHSYKRGALASAFQTIHVHAFAWLPIATADEIDQIILARLVMLLLEAGTVALIFVTARSFVQREAALLAALAYLSFGYVIQHGASFRFDPISTFLLMLAVALLARSRLQPFAMAIAGVAVALAGLVTVKSVFFLPTLAAIAAWRLQKAASRRQALVAFAVGALAGIVAFFGLYFLHQASLLGADLASSREGVTGSYAKTVGHGVLFPRADFLVRSALGSLIQWSLFLVGLAVAIPKFARGAESGERTAWVVVAFALPVLSLAFYRNAFPYYYAFMMAPVAVLAGVAVDRSRILQRLAPILGIALLGSAAVNFQAVTTPALAAQRATIAAVHEIFPQPVPYLDRCSMVASFPQAGFFMSTWVMEGYRSEGRPIMRDILEKQGPVFLIANSPALQDALLARIDPENPWALLDEDGAVLRENFVRHWGVIWVIAKTLQPAQSDETMDVLVPGPYTVESERPVEIDGQSYPPGAVVSLARGRHVVRSPGGRQSLVLRWGERLPRPQAAVPDSLLFTGL